MKAIGLNFADLMRRNGVYPMRGNAPYINGFEGADIVKDNNVHDECRIGDRVAFADVPFANADLVADGAISATVILIDFCTRFGQTFLNRCLRQYPNR